MLSGISQTKKDRYHIISHVCGIKKKQWVIDTENRLVVARVDGGLRVGEIGKMGDRDKVIQTFRYKINKSLGCNWQHSR